MARASGRVGRFAVDARAGEFTTTTNMPEVRCGLCGLAFTEPGYKAAHLRQEHSCRVRVLMNEHGIEVWRWERPVELGQGRL